MFFPSSVFRQTTPKSGDKTHEHASEKEKSCINQSFPKKGMLSFAKTQMRYYPYLSLFPGFAVVMSVMSLTLAGDGLRDAMDPRLRNG